MSRMTHRSTAHRPTAQDPPGVFGRVPLAAIALFLGLVPLLTRPAAAQDAPDAPSPSAGERVPIADLLAAFDNEPDIRAVQRAALEHATEGTAPLKRWRRRARWANLVPDVGGEVAWLDQRDSELRYDEDITTGEDGRMTREEASNRYVDDLRIRAVYAADFQLDLGGLVFDRDEIAIARESRHRVRARRELLTEVTALYFRRRKHQVLQMLAPRDDWQKRLGLILKVRSLTARIDALTGGWFRKQLDQSDEGGSK